jgi:hypothetical protein
VANCFIFNHTCPVHGWPTLCQDDHQWSERFYYKQVIEQKTTINYVDREHYRIYHSSVLKCQSPKAQEIHVLSFQKALSVLTTRVNTLQNV